MRRRPRGSRRRTGRGTSSAVDRAVGDAACRRLDLDQRLQPEQAARAVAHQLRCRRRGAAASALDRARRRRRRRPRARRRRGGRRPSSLTASIGVDAARSRRLASTRPTSSPSSHRRRGAGAVAEAVDRLDRDRPSAVVSCRPMPSRRRRCAARSRAPIDWQASARQSFSTWRPAGSAEIVVEGDDAVHLGAGQVQRVGQQRHRLARHIAEDRSAGRAGWATAALRSHHAMRSRHAPPRRPSPGVRAFRPTPFSGLLDRAALGCHPNNLGWAGAYTRFKYKARMN